MNNTRTLAVSLVIASVLALAHAGTYEVKVDSGSRGLTDGERTALASGDYTELKKTGGGSLAVENLTGFAGSVVVAEGEVRLSGSSVGGAAIDPGAKLVLDDAEQISDSGILVVNGEFDLNGHSETVGRFTNIQNSDADRSLTGRIINTFSEAVTLTASDESQGAMSCFCGTVEEAPGGISLVFKRSATFFGPENGIASSKIVMKNGYTELMCYTAFRRYDFRFHNVTDAGHPRFSLGEIQLTSNGVPIPQDCYETVKIFPGYSDGAGGVTNGPAFDLPSLIDGFGGTGHEFASGVVEVRALVSVKPSPKLPPVNGYRICGLGWNQQPRDWDVWGYRNVDLGTVRLDSRRDQQLTHPSANFNYNCSSNYLFSAPGRVSSALFGKDSEIELGQSLCDLRIMPNEPFTVGALTGPGYVRLEDSAIFAPRDLNGFTGRFMLANAVDAQTMCRIRIDGVNGPEEQAVRNVAPDTCNLTVENGGAAPAAVLLDDAHFTADEHLFGRMADGLGKLGLVKRGAGTCTLETQDASYTGPTLVKEGTLRVVEPKSGTPLATARHVRFHPVLNRMKKYDTYHYNWTLTEFVLVDSEGKDVIWPSGTSATLETGASAATAINGNLTDRLLVSNTAAEEAAQTGYCSYLQVDLGADVSFSGYKWYAMNDSDANKNRLPIQWKVLVSDDGVNWTSVAEETDTTALPATPTAGVERGPYEIGGFAQRSGSLFSAVPFSFFAGTTARSTRAPALKARYFRFAPYERYQRGGGDYNFGWHMSEFSLYRNGVRLDWGETAKAELKGCDLYTGSADQVIDNIRGRKGDAQNRMLAKGMPSELRIDAGTEVEFDAYGYTGCEGYPARLPAAWKLYVSADGETWYLADTQTDARDVLDVTTVNYAEQGPWSVADRFPLLDEGPSNALGDDSAVTVEEGAALELDVGYEKFGPLSGAGRLLFNFGGDAEIGTIDGTAASYSGRMDGVNELVVSGNGVQTFADADLTCVKKLTMNGGTIVGTLVAGDVELAFDGGAFGGVLSKAGTVTVSGTPVFDVPADVGASYVRTVISGAHLDAATQAAFAAARITVGGTASRRYVTRTEVTVTSVTIHVNKRGLMLMVR